MAGGIFMKIKKSSRLILVPLEIRKDKKNYIVEEKIKGEFYEMPALAIEAIIRLNKGIKIEIIEKELQELYPEEEVNMLDFAVQLEELGLVDQIDEQSLSIEKGEFSKVEGFTRIPPFLGKLFFNKIAYIVYTCVFFANVALFIKYPQLVPMYTDYFVFDWMSLNIILWLGIGTVLLIIHEMGHILSVRSKGFPTQLGINHRLMFLVLETDLTFAWKLPSKSRNSLFLGGLCFDMIILFLALAVQLFLSAGPFWIIAIAKVIVLDVFIRVLFQCGIYMKTDLYYVLENVTGSYNLMENARFLVRKKFGMKARNSGEVAYDGEKGTIIWYSFIYVIGIILTTSIFILYSVPQIIYIVGHSFEKLSNPIDSRTFIDGILVIIQTVAGAGFLFYSWSRKYSRIRTSE
jgi:putative peptide zinc metalloprotease protein